MPRQLPQQRPKGRRFAGKGERKGKADTDAARGAYGGADGGSIKSPPKPFVQLSVLNLSNCQLGAKAVVSLGKLIKHPMASAKLKLLDISNNPQIGSGAGGMLLLLRIVHGVFNDAKPTEEADGRAAGGSGSGGSGSWGSAVGGKVVLKMRNCGRVSTGIATWMRQHTSWQQGVCWHSLDAFSSCVIDMGLEGDI
jgi:hypothetical protein